MNDSVAPLTGPLDYYVVRLPAGDAMPFEAVREILSLVDAEIIAVIDLVIIERADDGSLSAMRRRLNSNLLIRCRPSEGMSRRS